MSVTKGPDSWFSRKTPENPPETERLSPEAFVVRCLAEGLVEVFGVNARNEKNAILAELFHVAEKSLYKTIDTSTLYLETLIGAIEAEDTKLVKAIITEIFKNTKNQTNRHGQQPELLPLAA